MAVERWDSLKWGSWRTDKFKISRRKYRLNIRFSFHHYLFPPLKRDTFCPNGVHYRWQLVMLQVTVQFTAQVLFVFWDSCAGRTAGKASRQRVIFRIPKTTFPSTRNVFLVTILNELAYFYMYIFLNLRFQAGITRGNTDWRYIWKTCIHETSSDELLNMTVGWTEIWIVLQQLCILVMKYWGEVRSEYSCWEINSQR